MTSVCFFVNNACLKIWHQKTAGFIIIISIAVGMSRLNVSGVLKIPGVSRSGYAAWKKRAASDRAVRKQNLKERILVLYKESHQNYGALKITKQLRREKASLKKQLGTIGGSLE